jgi:O-antigen ligase
VVIGCGIAANVSKAGLVLAVVIVCFWTWALRSSGVSSRVRPKVVLGCAVVAAIGVLGAWSRWAEVSGAMSTDGGRWLSWRVALHAWGRSPVTGSGPGTYKVLMPDIVADEVPELYRRWIVQDHVPGGRVSIWMHAHHDGLQALAEWGAIGTALLAVVVIGTLATAVSGARRATSPERVVFLAGAIALGTVLVHGSFDFPFHVASLQLAVVAWTAVVLSTAMREAWPRSVSRMNQL